MSSRPSKRQLSVWILSGSAILAMCAAAMQDHKVAFGFLGLFAMVGVFLPVDASAERLPPAWGVLLVALYFPSIGMLAAAEFDLLSAALVVGARWGFVSALAALLAIRIVGCYSSAESESDS